MTIQYFFPLLLISFGLTILLNIDSIKQMESCVGADTYDKEGVLHSNILNKNEE